MSETFPSRRFLRSGFSILPSQMLAIDHLMADLVRALPAAFALLTETSGQVIATQGHLITKQGDPINQVALGALVAGDLAASQEIARITGEYQDYQLIVRQGKDSNILISEVGHSFVLFAQVSDEVPLGWACLHILNTARRIAEALLSEPQEVEPEEPTLKESQLGDMVSRSLDSMWSEESDVR